MKHVKQLMGITIILICLASVMIWIDPQPCYAINKKSFVIDNSNGTLDDSWSCEVTTPVSASEASSDKASRYTSGESFSSEAMNSQLVSGKLSGQNQALYKALKTKIVKIAQGQITKTSFQIKPEKILGKKTFTEAELGVTIYDEATKNWGNDDRIRNAIYEQTTYSLSKVLYSLMVDCPYELYWFDKTVGIYASKPGRFELSSENGGTITILDQYNFRFAVSKKYAVTTSDQFTKDDVIYYLTVKQSKVEAAKQASANAEAYVKSCSRLSDYEKLMSYINFIMDAVSYNKKAASSNEYGDPWQLIYVFDKNPDTNVVCEGYAKALHYLCSLTTWDSSHVDCRLVSGTTYFDNTYGNHMWNLIHMPKNNDYTVSGKTYMVDLTNGDSENLQDNSCLIFAGKTSGSVQEGYRIHTNVGDIIYRYGTPATSVYSEKQLTISSTHYANLCTDQHNLKTIDPIVASPGNNGSTKGSQCVRCGWYKKKVKTVYAPESIQFSVDSACYTYTGKTRKPSFTVLNAKGVEIDSSYYQITWPGSGDYKLPGTYKVKVSFKAPAYWDTDQFYPYEGTLNAYFKIIPKGTKLEKLTAGQRKVTLRWSKQEIQTSGYQIQQATDSAFTKKLKKYTISGSDVNKYNVVNLSSDKKYYFRIRTFKEVNGKKYVSKWSSAKSCRTNG